MIYVLILVSAVGTSGNSMHTQEFSSQRACEVAAEWVRSRPVITRQTAATCVPKE